MGYYAVDGRQSAPATSTGGLLMLRRQERNVVEPKRASVHELPNAATRQVAARTAEIGHFLRSAFTPVITPYNPFADLLTKLEKIESPRALKKSARA